MAFIRFDFADAVRRVQNTARTLNTGRTLEIAGERVLDASQQAFRDSKDPATGSAWPALAASTIAGRRKGGGGARPLLDRGILRGSLVRGGGRNVWRRRGNTSLTVGTAVFYGAFHQFGGTRAYEIKPKRAKMLRFRGSKGQWVYARRVMHPPLKKRAFLGVSPALAATIAADLNRTIGDAMAGR